MLETPVLSVVDLHVGYGPIKAVRGVSLAIEAGETVAVVGANGAGKTTLLRALTNLLTPERGEARFRGRAIASLPTHALAAAGMLHLPEGRGVIGSLSVWENLRIGWEVRPARESFEAAVGRVYRRFPRLAERHQQRAGSLSGGEQQMVALARALINPPDLLLVDEPSLGLSPRLVGEVFEVLGEFKAAGMTVLLVEQNVRMALGFAHRGYVLKQGEIVLAGSGSDLLAEPDMLRHLLGGE
ncbi:MAG TPA: ABC transporter ATP-binding protein [Stellaceae bacterium]|nr:ABC transporter ATP-binding protein [Stellaceae bacterium]